MVNLLACSSSSSTDMSFGMEHCVVFLGKTVSFHWPRYTNGYQIANSQ